MSGNTKVAIECTDADGRIIITAVEDGCDPKQTVLRGMELSEAMEHVYPFIEESRVEWADAPKYQTYQKPKQPRKASKGASAPAAAVATTSPPEGATTTAELPLLAGPAPTEEADSGEVTSMVMENPESCDPEGEQPVATQRPEPDDDKGDGDSPENGDSDNGDQQPVAQEAAAKASRGAKYVYKVVIDGQEQQFDHTHDALRALGVPQEKIDEHKYWHRHDRLPKEYKERIDQVPVT